MLAKCPPSGAVLAQVSYAADEDEGEGEGEEEDCEVSSPFITATQPFHRLQKWRVRALLGWRPPLPPQLCRPACVILAQELIALKKRRDDLPQPICDGAFGSGSEGEDSESEASASPGTLARRAEPP